MRVNKKINYFKLYLVSVIPIKLLGVKLRVKKSALESASLSLFFSKSGKKVPNFCVFPGIYDMSRYIRNTLENTYRDL